MPKLDMICPKCRSIYVVCNGWAVWSVEAQKWELEGLYDTTTCEKCGYETDDGAEEVEYDEACADAETYRSNQDKE